MFWILLVLGLVVLAYVFRQVVVIGKSCKSNAKLHGKTVIVTGSNTGIGKTTAIELARRGARVILACRSKQRGEAALQDVKRLLSSGTLRSKMRTASCVKLGHVVKLYVASLTENPQIQSNKLTLKLKEETSLPDFIKALAVPVQAGGGPPVEDCDWGQSYSQESGSNQVVFMQLDLASLKSVRSFAENFLKTEPRLDILINNAGLYMMGRTEDGFGMMFGVNHLGHFLLTSLLLDRLKECGPSRVVNVSSTAHNWGRVDFDCLNTHRNLRVGASQIDSFGIYGDSKLCNVLFTHELAKRLKGTKVTCYSLHPGGIKTELARNAESSVQMILSFFGRFFFKTPLQGSQTTLHCALQEGIEHLSGRYFSNCTARHVFAKARDDAASKKLWEISERFCGI